MNLKGQNRYRATHKESLSTNKLNQNILFTKNKKLRNTMQCSLSLSQMETMTLNTKGMMPMHSTSLLLNTLIMKNRKTQHDL